VSPGQKTKKYDLYSLGADGMEGGIGDNADIGNWVIEN
jgi:general secretion pathway protein G